MRKTVLRVLGLLGFTIHTYGFLALPCDGTH